MVRVWCRYRYQTAARFVYRLKGLPISWRFTLQGLVAGLQQGVRSIRERPYGAGA